MMKTSIHPLPVALLSLLFVDCTSAENDDGGSDDTGGASSGGTVGQGGAPGGGSASGGTSGQTGGSAQGGSAAGAGGGAGTGPLRCDDPPRIPSVTERAEPVAETLFAAQFPGAACAAMQTCCTKSALPFDQAACEAFARTLLNATGSYDANAAGTCLADLALSRDCNGSLDFQGIPGWCSVVYRGALALGEICGGTEDCAPDPRGLVECEYSAAVGERICFVDERGQPGQACHYSCYERVTGECSPDFEQLDPAVRVTCHREDGLTCTDAGCAPLPPAGCPCILGLDYCNLENTCSASVGVCIARVGTGSACALDDECAHDLRCTGGTCVPSKPHGEACAAHSECRGGYCFGGVCQPDTGAVRLRFDAGFCGP